MPRLSRVQQDVRRRVLDLASRGLTPEHLGEALLALLRAVVPADGQWLFAVDPGSNLFNRLLAASLDDARTRIGWLGHVYLHGGPLGHLDFPGLMRDGVVATAFNDRREQCWGLSPRLREMVSSEDHYRIYHELDSPGALLRVCFPAHGRWVAALSLYRNESASPFRPGDVSFLRLLAPAVGQTLAAALARERAMLSHGLARDVPPEATGILLLGPDQRLRFSTPAGESWCDLLSHGEPGCGDVLPTAVRTAVAGLRRARSISEETALGVVRAIVVPTARGQVRVEASPGGEDGSVAVVLMAERPAGLPEPPESWPLTPGERQVVRLLLRGLSNRAIAERLLVSDNTIESHLRHAYEKLGVRSRTEVLARFFRETFWSTVDEPR